VKRQIQAAAAYHGHRETPRDAPHDQQRPHLTRRRAALDNTARTPGPGRWLSNDHAGDKAASSRRDKPPMGVTAGPRCARSAAPCGPRWWSPSHHLGNLHPSTPTPSPPSSTTATTATPPTATRRQTPPPPPLTPNFQILDPPLFIRILHDHGRGGRRRGGARQHDGDSCGADVPVGFGDGGPCGADSVLASAMTEI
jgi:hypothetical protein